MNVVITGATGMVGQIVLNHCINSNKIEKIYSFVRRKSGVENEKLEEIILDDFLNYQKYEKYFEKIDISYFCLGVYTGAVTDEKFKEITVDYTVAFSEMLKKQNKNVQFCFLSGAGADQTEKSRMSFARYKGMAENYLLQTFVNLSIFRPSYIYPVEKRIEPNFTYRFTRFLYPLIKLLGKKMSIKSTELGNAIFEAGIRKTDMKVLENRDILNF